MNLSHDWNTPMKRSSRRGHIRCNTTLDVLMSLLSVRRCSILLRRGSLLSTRRRELKVKSGCDRRCGDRKRYSRRESLQSICRESKYHCGTISKTSTYPFSNHDAFPKTSHKTNAWPCDTTIILCPPLRVRPKAWLLATQRCMFTAAL